MFFWYRVLDRGNTLTLFHYLSICFLCTGLCFQVNAQTMKTPVPFTEKGKNGKGWREESVITVKAEDIEHAVIKEEEVKEQVGKAIDEIKSFMVNLEQEEKVLALSHDRLQREKNDYQGRKGNPKYLELLEKDIEAMKEKRDIDNELIETYNDRISALHDQAKVYSDQVVHLMSIFLLGDIIAITPHDAIPEILKEIDFAREKITEIQEDVKEKSSVVSFFTNRLKEIVDKAFIDDQKLVKDFKSEKEGMREDEFTKKAQVKFDSIIKWKQAVNGQRITIFKTRLGTSKIRYDVGLQTWKNAEIHTAFLAEKVRCLEERQKE